jgi:hypothetical protein
MTEPKAPTSVASPEVDKARQKARARAIAAGLVLFALLFYFLTIFKMGPGILKRGL